MTEDNATTSRGSLEFRQNQEDIKSGKIPEKYSRMLPYVKGRRILEIGSAEGVFALLLSKEKDKVYGLEQNLNRHKKALELQRSWESQGIDVSKCEMIHDNIFERLDLLEKVDTVFSSRCIYYFKENIYTCFNEIGKKIKNVTLCGNHKRAKRFETCKGRFLAGHLLILMQKLGLNRILGRNLDMNLGFYEYFASKRGMENLLIRNGYEITDINDDASKDVIIVGEKQF